MVFGTDRLLHDWELEQLSKEIVLNAQTLGNLSLVKWNNLATALNKLRRLNEDVYEATPDNAEKILFELFRIAHRQFPWQRKPNTGWLARHFRIFSHHKLSAILENRLGLTPAQIYAIGLTLIGNYAGNFAIPRSLKMELPHLTQDHFEKFVSHFSIDLPTLKKLVGDSQRYDEDYVYAFNPMRQYPLLALDINSQKVLAAPIPIFLFHRLTSGLYYDSVSAVDFSDAFGASFQTYVGEAVGVSWRKLGPVERSAL